MNDIDLQVFRDMRATGNLIQNNSIKEQKNVELSLSELKKRFGDNSNEIFLQQANRCLNELQLFLDFEKYEQNILKSHRWHYIVLDEAFLRDDNERNLMINSFCNILQMDKADYIEYKQSFNILNNFDIHYNCLFKDLDIVLGDYWRYNHIVSCRKYLTPVWLLPNNIPVFIEYHVELKDGKVIGVKNPWDFDWVKVNYNIFNNVKSVDKMFRSIVLDIDYDYSVHLKDCMEQICPILENVFKDQDHIVCSIIFNENQWYLNAIENDPLNFSSRGFNVIRKEDTA